MITVIINPFVPPYIQLLLNDMALTISNNTIIERLPSKVTSLIFEFMDLKSITWFCEKYLDLKSVIKKHLYYLNYKEALSEKEKEFLYPFKTIELYIPGHEGEFNNEETQDHSFVRIMVWAEKVFDLKHMHSTYFKVMFRSLGLVSSITKIKLGEGKMLFDIVVKNESKKLYTKLLIPNNFIIDIREELLRSNRVPFIVTKLRIWSLLYEKEYKKDCSVDCSPNSLGIDSEDECWVGNLSNLGHYFETFSLSKRNSSLFNRMAEVTRWRPTLSQLSSNSEQIEELKVEIRNEVTKIRTEITEFKNELVQAVKITQIPTQVRIYARRAKGPFKCVIFSLDASNDQVLKVVRTTLGSSDIVAMCDKDQLFLYDCGEHFENGKQYYALSQQEYDEFLLKYKY